MKASKAIKILEKKSKKLSKKYSNFNHVTDEYMRVLIQCEKYNIELDNSFLDGYEALIKGGNYGK